MNAQDRDYVPDWGSGKESSPRSAMGNGKDKTMRIGSLAGCATSILLILVILALHFGTVRAQEMAGDSPAICRVGVNIEDLYDFDLARESFGVVLWLWSLCPSADPAPLETIVFRTAMPGLQLGEVRGTPLGDGALYQYRRVQGTFRHDWDMSRYPFDRHRLVIPFDESDLGAATVVFEPDLEASFLSSELRSRLPEWDISEIELEASITEEASDYGLPDEQVVGYARIEAALDLRRTQLLAFVKLTFGAFAAALIAFLCLYLDPREKGTFGTRLGLLVGVLFAVLLNLRAADAFIGDVGRPTLVTEIHLAVLVLLVVIALLALSDHLRTARDLPVRYPDRPLLATIAGIYGLINVGLIARAAWG